MLYLDAPIGPINGLTIFRDHAAGNRFYYISERPRLSRAENGRPEFLFLTYARDITDNPNLTPDQKSQLGGGFLAFTVDLTVDPAVFEDTRRKLAVFSDGTVELGPVLFRKGTVRLSIAKDVADAEGATADTPRGESFFEHVYGTTKPSLLGENRATFGVKLDHEGALLMEAALRSGISPIGVIYDLEYLGMRPAFHVKIHADYKRIYSSLETSFGLRAGVGPIALAANVDLSWQKLREDGSIKVEVLNFTDDESFRKQADTAFDWFKTELMRDFFKSSLEPPSFMRQGQNSGVLASLQSLLGPLTTTQQGTSAPIYGAPTTLMPTPAAPPTAPDSGVASTADRNRAAAGQGPTGPGGPAAGQGGLSVGVQLGFSLKKIEVDELKTREFEYSMQAAVSREAAPQGMFSTFVDGLDLANAIRRVNLDDDFFKRINAQFTLGANLEAEKIAAVTVNVEYPGVRPPGVQPDQVAGFTFTPGAVAPQTFQTWLNQDKDLRYRYRIGVDFASQSEWVGNEPHYESDWIETTEQDVSINPMEALDLLDVTITRTGTSEDVQQVQAELEYADPAGTFRAQQVFVLEDSTSKHWKLRFADAGPKQFRYRLTYFLPDNVRYRTEWLTSEPVTIEVASLVVNDPFEGQLRMRLFPLLDTSELLEANVDLVYTDEATGYEVRRLVTLPGGPGVVLTAQTITIPTLSADPASLTATTTIVRTDGSVFEQGPTAMPADKAVIIVSDGVGTARRIMVQLAGGDLAAAGLAAVRVRLTGPGEQPDHADTVFRPGAQDPRAVILVQPVEGPFTVRYEVEGYTAQGLPRAGQTGETADDDIVLPLPG